MFSMIYLWLIGAVVLAGADILLGTIYLLIIAVAALAAFIFAVIGAGILFQLLAFAVFAIAGCVYLSYRKRKNSVSTDAKPEKGSPMVPGLWEIVGMSGNTLIIKLKQEK